MITAGYEYDTMTPCELTGKRSVEKNWLHMVLIKCFMARWIVGSYQQTRTTAPKDRGCVWMLVSRQIVYCHSSVIP